MGLSGRILTDTKAPVYDAPLVLSVFSTLAIGGPQVRFIALANALARSFRHLVFSLDGRYDVLDRLDPGAPVERAYFDFPHAGTVANVTAAYKALCGLRPALLMTYNWGSIEWALAANFTKIAHIHVVDGFGPDEVQRQLSRRVWFRRAALSRCKKVVVPSQTLSRLAREVWHLRADKITQIPNGIDVDRFARPPDHNLISALGVPSDRPIIGTVSVLRREKNLARLLRAVALLPIRCRSHWLSSAKGQSAKSSSPKRRRWDSMIRSYLLAI